MTYDQRHAKRFNLSLAALTPVLQPGMRVLECGQRSSFALTVERVCRVTVEATGTEDLRLPLAALPPASFHAALCMEVFEHIHDQEPDLEVPTEWAGTGTRCLLASILQALKPGGFLFLTTPNAASLNVLHKVLTQQPPMVYRPHVREYGPHELAVLVRNAGFREVTVTSHDCWDNDCMTREQERRLREMSHRLGYPTDCRGEDLFLTARKPS